MNNPEYILVDELAIVVSKVKAALSLSVLNYQYGYVSELAETLSQFSKTPENSILKYPLIWFVQPFTITRGTLGIYGSLDNGRLFIIQESAKTYKAGERMSTTFKPVIYPVYRELLHQLSKHKPFSIIGEVQHQTTDRYYWGEEQQRLIGDVFDCMEISQLKIKIKNNQNC